jgi:hypothetical protein
MSLPVSYAKHLCVFVEPSPPTCLISRLLSTQPSLYIFVGYVLGYSSKNSVLSNKWSICALDSRADMNWLFMSNL